MLWLHSAEVVWELLRKGEIKVRAKIANNWENWWDVSYEDWLNLEPAKKERIQIKMADDPRTWSQLKREGDLIVKTLFPENWSKEDILEAFVKAEKEIKDGFEWKMVKELDEKMLEKYLREWWEWERLGLNDIEKRDSYFESFKNWKLNLEFWKFGKQFNWNVIEVNWLEIRVWWKYVYKDWKYVLSEEVNTLFPNK